MVEKGFIRGNWVKKAFTVKSALNYGRKCQRGVARITTSQMESFETVNGDRTIVAKFPILDICEGSG